MSMWASSCRRTASGLLHLLGRGDEQQARLGVLEDICDLGHCQRVVDRDVEHTGAQTSEVGYEPLPPVLREDRHLVATRQPEGREPRRGGPHDLIDFAETQIGEAVTRIREVAIRQSVAITVARIPETN